MNETSKESTAPSGDTINVLPILSEAKAPVSLTLTVDKSVSKLASWVIALILCLSAVSFVSGTVTVLTVYNSKQSHSDAEYRYRILQNHVDEMTVQMKLVCGRISDPECTKKVKESVDKLAKEQSNAGR